MDVNGRDIIKPHMPLGRQTWSLKHQESIMAVGLGSRQAADEEARAEVEVLNSRLEKTRILNSKLSASLQRLEGSGKRVRDAIGPLAGDTSNLRVLQSNIDQIVEAIERIRKPSDVKGSEEEIIRRGPASNLAQYLNSIKHISRALAELQQTNLRSNQQAIADLSRLLKIGNSALETHFKEILQEDSKPEEPLRFITKKLPFPTFKSNSSTKLSLINQYMVANAQQNGAFSGSPMIKAYADVRSPYLVSMLANLASASLNTAKKKNQDDIYKARTNGMGMYAEGIQGAFLAEYENICVLFIRDEWSQAFNLTTQAAVSELSRTLRELNSHIKANLNTDCFLAYEIIEIISNLSTELEKRTGELKTSFAAALKPVRDTGKSSLADLLEETRRRIANLPTIPVDGAAIPITSETMTRLQTMTEFMDPISGLMISIGDSGWKSSSASVAGYSTDQIPTLNSFNISADGKVIFGHYCIDTIIALLESLDRKAQPLAKNKSVSGVFLLNNIAIIERMIKYSPLFALLEQEPRLAEIENWKKRSAKDYSIPWSDVSRQLMDVIRTGQGHRPPSGSQNDSAAIVKAMSSKEKDALKEKFRVFNTIFDELVQKHKSLNMEPEVKTNLARDVQGMVELLYHRFWDKYHEIDKGKGKYVKYDKAAMSATFVSLST